MKALVLCLIVSISSLIAKPEAIIFDFGGVMTGELNQTALPKWLCKTCSLSETDFAKAREARRASGTPDKVFWRSWAESNKIPLSENFEKEFDAVMKKSINPNMSMYSLIYKLKKKGIQIGMLSNIDKRYGDLVEELGFYAPFNPCILSHQIGIVKPNLEAYEYLVKTLGIPRGEILFVDDKKENSDAALKAGLDAVLFTSYDTFVEELEKRGVKID